MQRLGMLSDLVYSSDMHEECVAWYFCPWLEIKVPESCKSCPINNETTPFCNVTYSVLYFLFFGTLTGLNGQDRSASNLRLWGLIHNIVYSHPNRVSRHIKQVGMEG